MSIACADKVDEFGLEGGACAKNGEVVNVKDNDAITRMGVGIGIEWEALEIDARVQGGEARCRILEASGRVEHGCIEILIVDVVTLFGAVLSTDNGAELASQVAIEEVRGKTCDELARRRGPVRKPILVDEGGRDVAGKEFELIVIASVCSIAKDEGENEEMVGDIGGDGVSVSVGVGWLAHRRSGSDPPRSHLISAYKGPCFANRWHRGRRPAAISVGRIGRSSESS